MSKRKFDTISGENEWAEQSPQRKVKDKNSLDSDEEEEEQEGSKYALQDEDIEGQEEGGAIVEEGVQFTPFNMKEEMEEGHFDKEGMYHWKKEKGIKDSWLDDIDWVKIKSGESNVNQKGENSDDEMPEAVDTTALYKKILTYMEPKETIAKTLRRLGGNKSLSASERLKLKKAGLLQKALDAEKNENVTELTELANKILTHSGNMDIYQESYEHINDLINASSSKSKKEPELDMYADDFGEKEQERLNVPMSSAPEPQKEVHKDNEVTWEYKEDQNGDIKGPYSTQQMEKWAQEGKFGKGVSVRKCGTIQFYNSKRVDFDLYL